VDGGPSSQIGHENVGGLFEIWEDAASGLLDPGEHTDLGATRPALGPRSGNVQVRWFVVAPFPEGVPKEQLDAAMRTSFAMVDGAHHVIDQQRHPAMHETQTIDVICVLQGEVSLILEAGETRLKPGQVVIQRGTNHAWQAHGGPALLLAVLIDRPLKR
jgi:quercetin dioxygenase-like cupin family protein